MQEINTSTATKNRYFSFDYFRAIDTIFVPNQHLQLMWSDHQKALMQAKIDARHYSRELIRDVFQATEHFPKNDPEHIAPQLRKKVLTVSSFLAHGTVKTSSDEQKEALLVVMSELREVLKFITIAHHLRYASDLEKHKVRTGITNLINSLDKLAILLGGFDKK